MKLKHVPFEFETQVIESLIYLESNVQNPLDRFHLTRLEAALIQRPAMNEREED